MKLWLLRPVGHPVLNPDTGHHADFYPDEGEEELPPEWNPWFGRLFGAIVCAETEYEARRSLADEAGPEGAGVWRDASRTFCMELSPDHLAAGIYMLDHHWA